MRFFSIILVLITILSIFVIPIQAKDQTQTPNMKFDCTSAILMEASTGTVLYEYNADTPLPPASVTKIMTLLLVMEAIDSGTIKYTDTITTSSYAASMGGSQVFLKEGEQLSAEDMIKSVVIASANDAAVALAEHLCGSESAFVERMNSKAKELGMKNTNFENTNGLDDTATNHYVSARDIAIMSQELLKHPDILKYTTIWMDTIRNGSFGLTNTNRLVRFYPGTTGLKTGSTSKAKFCVSATAKRDNMHLICVIMGAPSSDVRNSITTQLLNWGFANFDLYEDVNNEISPIKINAGKENTCHIKSNDFRIVVKKGTKNKIEKTYVIPANIKAPVNKGDEVGYIEYKYNGQIIGKSPILSSIKVDKIDFGTLFVRILSKFCIK